MVVSTMTGITGPKVPATLPSTEASITESSVVKKITADEIDNIMSTEQFVRQYFKDVPIMIEIAKCESHFRQLDSDGEIHRGVVNNADVGVMQINELYHLNTAKRENLNIYTLEGNTAYARDLYERQGTDPWNSSRACWGKYVATGENKDLAINK